MKIEILGVGCPKCKQLLANTEIAVKELNIGGDRESYGYQQDHGLWRDDDSRAGNRRQYSELRQSIEQRRYQETHFKIGGWSNG
jgi:hypothetical protein